MARQKENIRNNKYYITNCVWEYVCLAMPLLRIPLRIHLVSLFVSNVVLCFRPLQFVIIISFLILSTSNVSRYFPKILLFSEYFSICVYFPHMFLFCSYIDPT